MIPQQDQWLAMMAFFAMIGAIFLDGILFIILIRLIDDAKRPGKK